MNYKCADRGGLRCPCILMAAGQCYTCSMVRDGRCDCSENWQGVCPYNEFLQGGMQVCGAAEEFAVPIIETKHYSQQLTVLTLLVPVGFAQRCKEAGSFVTVSSMGFRVPLSVLRAGDAEAKVSGTAGPWGEIRLAIQPTGPKTKELIKLNSGQKVKIAGPFVTGLAGADCLDMTEGDGSFDFLVVARGTAVAPFLNIKERFGEKSVIMVDNEKLPAAFLDDYMGDIRYEIIRLPDDEGKVLAAVDRCHRAMLLLSPYYVERILKLRHERKGDIIFPNHANMCCGSGVCGACSFTDGDGITVRRCKCSRSDA